MPPVPTVKTARSTYWIFLEQMFLSYVMSHIRHNMVSYIISSPVIFDISLSPRLCSGPTLRFAPHVSMLLSIGFVFRATFHINVSAVIGDDRLLSPNLQSHQEVKSMETA
ncbi:hypothetical protein AVEN_149043-1 [Araneus ventricosus]|uniref:Uncharacterized protein n=1 Tax=Araneus ventricosus TaxID=182803 RepID=A0A4Y2A696_ARAVE|nr:hypothetical protein AVEN_149043-1 [Araneus ventricosus]